MRFTVGGRDLDLTREQVVAKLKGVSPEPIREHFVSVGDRKFPPKQILAVVTGWERQTYTTFEAQRVLLRLGFDCRRVGEGGDGSRPPAGAAVGSDEPERELSARLALAEAQLATAQVAIAGLSARLERLENAGS
ncbi:MAG: hypothetical protein ACT4OX_14945 [Actinomycetota bacterium]